MTMTTLRLHARVVKGEIQLAEVDSRVYIFQ